VGGSGTSIPADFFDFKRKKKIRWKGTKERERRKKKKDAPKKKREVPNSQA
jgi:hypothetical protein